jgi:hypothetical protein
VRSAAYVAFTAAIAVLPARHGTAQTATAIQGLVVDAMGEPVEGAVVRVAEIRFHDGRRRVADRAAAVASTDDHGRYRLQGLSAGRYLVIATTADSPEAQRPTAFFELLFPPRPTTPVEISIQTGQTTTADLSMAPVPASRITGRVLNAAGRPMTTTLVLEPSARSGAYAPPPKGGTIFPDGRFEFANVPPGDYAIQAFKTRQNTNTEGEFAGAYVTVSGANVDGVELKTTIGSTVKGRLTYADDEPIPQGRFVVTPARADLDQTLFFTELAHGHVNTDQTFELHGLHGPRRLVLEEAPAGWILKAVRVKGEDVTDIPLPFGTPKESLDDVEIVVTRRTATMTGFVQDEHGARVRSSLLVFPADRMLWYPASRFFRHVEADAEGRFEVAAMAAADYFVAAVASFDSLDDSWQDPEVLERVAGRATRVTVSAGARVVVTAPLLR